MHSALVIIERRRPLFPQDFQTLQHFSAQFNAAVSEHQKQIEVLGETCVLVKLHAGAAALSAVLAVAVQYAAHYAYRVLFSEEEPKWV